MAKKDYPWSLVEKVKVVSVEDMVWTRIEAKVHSQQWFVGQVIAKWSWAIVLIAFLNIGLGWFVLNKSEVSKAQELNQPYTQYYVSYE